MMNKGIIAIILKFALPVKVVVKDIRAGPTIAANLPKILKKPKNSLEFSLGIIFAK
ncbi:hypothetical protein D3C81_2033230 [compost metagenome]